MKDPYKVLGVPPDASDDEIKKAYRALARKYHPDNYNGSDLADLAEEKMKEVNEAYDAVKKMRETGQSYSEHDGVILMSQAEFFSDVDQFLLVGRQFNGFLRAFFSVSGVFCCSRCFADRSDFGFGRFDHRDGRKGIQNRFSLFVLFGHCFVSGEEGVAKECPFDAQKDRRRYWYSGKRLFR